MEYLQVRARNIGIGHQWENRCEKIIYISFDARVRKRAFFFHIPNGEITLARAHSS